MPLEPVASPPENLAPSPGGIEIEPRHRSAEAEEGSRSIDAIKAIGHRIRVAFPPRTRDLEQDEEWFVFNTGAGWRDMRLHDYDALFPVPGLYERVVYDVFRCESPRVIRDLLAEAVANLGIDASEARVLDLGAGNGHVAARLHEAGFRRFVGVDLSAPAREAAKRDFPGLYDDYAVGDLLNLPRAESVKLDRASFDVMTCVAALGFGDTPPAVFAAAMNRVRDGGLIAFTIRSDFLDADDRSGFRALVETLLDRDALTGLRRKTYTHRVNAAGMPIEYTACLATKTRDAQPDDIPAA